jgi:hypothetical protein
MPYVVGCDTPLQSSNPPSRPGLHTSFTSRARRWRHGPVCDVEGRAHRPGASQGLSMKSTSSLWLVTLLGACSVKQDHVRARSVFASNYSCPEDAVVLEEQARLRNQGTSCSRHTVRGCGFERDVFCRWSGVAEPRCTLVFERGPPVRRVYGEVPNEPDDKDERPTCP